MNKDAEEHDIVLLDDKGGKFLIKDLE